MMNCYPKQNRGEGEEGGPLFTLNLIKREREKGLGIWGTYKTTQWPPTQHAKI